MPHFVSALLILGFSKMVEKKTWIGNSLDFIVKKKHTDKPTFFFIDFFFSLFKLIFNTVQLFTRIILYFSYVDVLPLRELRTANIDFFVFMYLLL